MISHLRLMNVPFIVSCAVLAQELLADAGSKDYDEDGILDVPDRSNLRLVARVA